MPRQSDRNILLIGAVILVMMFAGLALLAPQGDDPGHPSSYSTKARGGKAAFLLLKQSGYNVERWQAPPERLSELLTGGGAGTVLVIAEPLVPAGGEEKAALRKFVTSGGTLLLAGFSTNGMAPGMRLSGQDARIGWAECRPAAATRLARGGPVSMDGAGNWNSDDRARLVHFEHDGSPVVVSYAYEKGQVIWWASALPFTNAGIRDRHNLDLFLNSVGAARRVLWDEYFQTPGKSPWAYASGPALTWGTVHLALFALVVLATFARRSGPLVPMPVVSRLTPLEFVDTLGGLYGRAHATQAAVEIAFSRFRQIASRRLGMRGQLAAAEVAAAIEAHRLAPGTDSASMLKRCEQAISNPGLPESEALKLVQFLSDASRALEKLAG